MECKSKNDKTRIKQEHETTLDTHYVEYRGTKIGLKQEIWDPPEPDLVPCLDTGIIKSDVEIDIKMENLWSEEKEGYLEKNKVAEDVQSSRSSTELVNEHSSFYTSLDSEKDVASDSETVNAKNVNKGSSVTQNICSLNCNPPTDKDNFEAEQIVANEQSFSNQQLLNGHSLYRVKGNSYSCDTRKKRLRRKTNKHTLFNTYECEHCGKSFTKKSYLKEHTLIHSGKKPYKCEHCEKCFTQKSSLGFHKLIHSGEKPYRCKDCGKCFTWKSSFDSHTLIHSGTKPYKCKHCEKCFTWKSTLDSHTLIHSGKKPYKCEHCGKCFTQKSTLDSHTLIHSGTKPYKCEHCEKFFTQKSTLDRHIVLHTGTKPYKCEHCEKLFTQKSSLDRHILLHSGTKPYKCQHCEKCFAQKSQLLRHTMLLTRTKPYKCEYCEKCFVQKTQLKQHIVIHSGTEQYKCEQCGTCFAKKSSFDRHALDHSDHLMECKSEDDKTRIKQNQEISQNQNEVGCEVKQETWNMVPCLETGTIKDEINIKEGTWWCEEKEEDLWNNEMNEDAQPSR